MGRGGGGGLIGGILTCKRDLIKILGNHCIVEGQLHDVLNIIGNISLHKSILRTVFFRFRLRTVFFQKLAQIAETKHHYNP